MSDGLTDDRRREIQAEARAMVQKLLKLMRDLLEKLGIDPEAEDPAAV